MACYYGGGEMRDSYSACNGILHSLFGTGMGAKPVIQVFLIAYPDFVFLAYPLLQVQTLS